MVFKSVHYSDIKNSEVKESGVKKTKVRWLISKDDGAKNFAMRCFEITPGGHTPHHSHEWEHEVFVLDGECSVTCGVKHEKAELDYVIFIPPNEKHQFRNEGTKVLRFLCLVPHHIK